jgi:hypothetical protein
MRMQNTRGYAFKLNQQESQLRKIVDHALSELLLEMNLPE